MIRAMSDDRAVGALERGMRRPLALATAAFFIAIAVFVLGVSLIVDSTTRVSFPSSVAVASPLPSRSATPVTFPAAVVGKTTHAALTRGGRATTQTPTSGEAGQVSVRVQTTAPAVPSRSTRPAPTTP
jgi:hypothetical protein